MKTPLSVKAIIAILFVCIACVTNPDKPTETITENCDTVNIVDTTEKIKPVINLDTGTSVEDSIINETPPPADKSCRDLFTELETLLAQYEMTRSEKADKKFESIRGRDDFKNCLRQDSNFKRKFSGLESRKYKISGPPSLN